MAKYSLPRGTKDYLKEECARYDYINNVLSEMATLYGFEHIQTPIFEHTDVFTRSVGESSDIVNKEMYTFLDKGGRSITLRPEGTAGVCRAYVENKCYATCEIPFKAYYSGPVFRYERPQAGRYRQIHQFGFEVIGVKNPYLDVEIILLAHQSLLALGITNYVFKLNCIGDDESRNNYKQALKEYFEPHLNELCEDCKVRFIKNPLRILDCKVDGDKEVIKNAPRISKYLTEDSKNYFVKVCMLLDKYQVPYEIDQSLVRGLDYYTGTVFEIACLGPNGENFGAIGGGGRYDNLVKEFDGPDTPAFGMAFGMERLLLIMDKYNLFNADLIRTFSYCMPIGEENMEYASFICNYLRSNGFPCDIDYRNRSIKAMFKTVDKRHAQFALIIGDDERKNNTVNVKNNETKEQVNIKFEQLIPFFENYFNNLNKHNDECHCDECKGE